MTSASVSCWSLTFNSLSRDHGGLVCSVA
jgi:hypothetical protein